ncbi:MAG: Xaa-Pro aminopeptidase [Gammaproteobacteria bacterium]|nr:MAG: Xaa-Pro aminopeptidase [Gammaproteobacteria bacterium]
MKITKKEFAARRSELMALMEPDSIAVLPAAPVRSRNRDVDYQYRQDSDFYYLTGFAEPEAVLVLIPGRKHGECVLFCRERDPKMEIWDGCRAGPEGAIKKYGADDAFPIADLDEILPGLIEGRERVYYAMGSDPTFDRQVMDWVNAIRAKVRTGAHPPGEFISLDHLLHDMRLFKSKAEIRMMKRAAEITANAHVRAMETCSPGMMEYQLEAEYLHEFAREGARYPAYPSIVGGGANGCILHYIENASELKKGDLVLVDAGAEYDHYAADITRTFPVSGVFSGPQKQLYEVVLKAQLAAIREVKPGNHWNQSHEAAVKVITRGLVKLGLLKGKVDQLIKNGSYTKYYMHRTGHWLGMDVHDVGDYKVGGEWRVLEEGMVLTVEPGIYVPKDDKDVDEKWRGIGIRIEDDVVVTAKGHQVLTKGVPKKVDEIEALMAAAQKSRGSHCEAP